MATQFKSDFIALVTTIISNEYSEAQKELFNIEGEEIINDLFEHNTTVIHKVKAKFDYSLHPGAADLVKLSADFTTIVISLFSVYLNFSKAKQDKVKSTMDKIDVKKRLKEELLNGNVSSEFADKIVTKYQRDLTE